MWKDNLGTITLRHKSDRNRSEKRRVGIYAALGIALGIFLPAAAQQTATITVPDSLSRDLAHGVTTLDVTWTAPTTSDGSAVTCSVQAGSTATLLTDLTGGSFPIGSTVVTCTALSAANPESFAVTILKRPFITVTSVSASLDVNTEITLSASAAYGPDGVPGQFTWIITPDSGFTHSTSGASNETLTFTPHVTGTYNLRALFTATDTASYSSIFGSATVIVNNPGTGADTTPPVWAFLTLVQNIVELLNTDTNILAVTWIDPTATDDSGVAPGVTCTPASGSNFPIGTTPVTCTATDEAGNAVDDTFTVTVLDGVRPVFVTEQSNIIVEAAQGETTAVASWPTPIARDNSGADPTIVCTPPSGSAFVIGTTFVGCTATDATGNRVSFPFTVTVSPPPDTTPPEWVANTLVQDINRSLTTDTNTLAVTWTDPTATDDSGVAPGVACTPPSGSAFAIGTATVTCTATDGAGNAVDDTFTVDVLDKAFPAFVTGQSNIIVDRDTGQTTAMVSWPTPTARDNSGDAPRISIVQDGGVALTTTNGIVSGTFPTGTTSIVYSATDSSGNMASLGFTVTVTIPTMTSLTLSPNRADTGTEVTGTVTVMPSNHLGGVVSFAVTDSSNADVNIDNLDDINIDGGTNSISSMFTIPAATPNGDYTVTATFTPTTGTHSASLGTATLTVATIASAPTITVPPNQTATLESGQTTVDVTWDEITATNGNQVTCTVIRMPMGSTVTLLTLTGGTFPLGETLIGCTATGTTGTGFAVTVTLPAAGFKQLLISASSSLTIAPGDEVTVGLERLYGEAGGNVAFVAVATDGSTRTDLVIESLINPLPVSSSTAYNSIRLTFPDTIAPGMYKIEATFTPTSAGYTAVTETVQNTQVTPAADAVITVTGAAGTALTTTTVLSLDYTSARFDPSLTGMATVPVTGTVTVTPAGAAGTISIEFDDSGSNQESYSIAAGETVIPIAVYVRATPGITAPVTASFASSDISAYANSESAGVDVTVTSNPLTTTSLAIPTSVQPGSTVSGTVTVTPVGAEGRINVILGDGTIIASPTINLYSSGDNFTFTAPAATGSYSIRAAFISHNTSGYENSGSGLQSFEVAATGGQTTTTTVLSLDYNSARVNDAPNLAGTVTVTPAGAAGTINLQFGDGVSDHLQESYSIAAGETVIPIIAFIGQSPGLTAPVTASFTSSDISTYANSVSAGVDVTVTVNPETTTNLAIPASVQQGSTVSGTVTVTPVSASGSINVILGDGTIIASPTITAGSTEANFTFTAPSATGSYSIRAAFISDDTSAHENSGSGLQSFTVTVASAGTALTTTTVLSLDYTSVRFDPRPTDMASLPVTGTVTVTPAGAAGTININFGSVGSTGQESYSIAAGETVVPIIVHVGATPGRIPVTASFTSSDESAFASSESDGVDVTVTSNPLTTTNLAIPASVQPGSTVSGTVTVTPVGAWGAVNVIIGSTTVASPTIAAGSTEADFTFTAPSAAGSYSIRAAFISNDISAHENSGSGLQSFTVTVASTGTALATTTVLSLDYNTARFDPSLTGMATVPVTGTVAVTPAGAAGTISIEFGSGGGQESYSIAAGETMIPIAVYVRATPGLTKPVTASFASSDVSAYTNSESAGVDLAVTSNPLTTTSLAIPTSVQPGSTVSGTVTVTPDGASGRINVILGDGTIIASPTITAGSTEANFTFTAPAATGSYSIRAAFISDNISGYENSGSGLQSFEVAATGGQMTTTTVLSLDYTSARVDVAPNLAGTVTVTPAGAAGTINLQFGNGQANALQESYSIAAGETVVPIIAYIGSSPGFTAPVTASFTSSDIPAYANSVSAEVDVTVTSNPLTTTSLAIPASVQQGSTVSGKVTVTPVGASGTVNVIIGDNNNVIIGDVINVPIAAGSTEADFTFTAPSATGSYSIRAAFISDDTSAHENSGSGLQSFTVTVASTGTALATTTVLSLDYTSARVDVAPNLAGTVTVTPAGAAGTINLQFGTSVTDLQESYSIAAGQTVVPIIAYIGLSPFTAPIVASFTSSDESAYANSESAGVDLTVTVNPETTTNLAIPASVQQGSTVSGKVTVTPAGAWGRVNVIIGDSTNVIIGDITSVPIAAGSTEADFTFTAPAVAGSYSIRAAFISNDISAHENSGSDLQSFTVTVAAAGTALRTTTGLSLDYTSTRVSANLIPTPTVTGTVTVTPAGAAGTINLQFGDSGIGQESYSIAAGETVVPIAVYLGATPHVTAPVTASFTSSDESAFANSESDGVDVAVTNNPETTTNLAIPASAQPGSTVSGTVTVTPDDAWGSVNVIIGDNNNVIIGDIIRVPIAARSAGGNFTFTAPSATGSYSIRAAFISNNTSTHENSGSGLQSFNVTTTGGQTTTTTVLSLDYNSARANPNRNPTTGTVTVTPAGAAGTISIEFGSGGSGRQESYSIAAGETAVPIIVYVGATPLTAAVVASFTSSDISAYANSESAGVDLTVTGNPETTTSLTIPVSVQQGSTVSGTVTVTPDGASGRINVILGDGTIVASPTIAAGSTEATFAFTAPSATGSYSIRAAFISDDTSAYENSGSGLQLFAVTTTGPPTITVPGNQSTTLASGETTAPLTWDVVTASDGSTVTCTASPTVGASSITLSGGTFEVGSYTITCSATGADDASFTVTVYEPTIITVPGDQIRSEEAAGVDVTWVAPTASNGMPVTCTVPDGSGATLTPTTGINPTGGNFPQGDTVVTCSATGAADASFTVLVAPVIFNALKISGITEADGSITFPKADGSTDGQTFRYLEVVQNIKATTDSSQYPSGVATGDTWTFPDGSQATQSSHFQSDITINYGDGMDESDTLAYFVSLSNGDVWQIETSNNDDIYEAKSIRSFTVNSFNEYFDWWGAIFSGSFTETIVVPTITTPGNRIATLASGATTAPLTWVTPTASDRSDVTCTVPDDSTATLTPTTGINPNGGRFPRGDTVVTCSATDTSGNTEEETFTVTATEVIIFNALKISGVPKTSGVTDGQTFDYVDVQQIAATTTRYNDVVSNPEAFSDSDLLGRFEGDVWIFADGSLATQGSIFVLQITVNYADGTSASDSRAYFVTLSNGEVWQIETKADDAIYEAKPITSFTDRFYSRTYSTWDSSFAGSLTGVIIPPIMTPGDQTVALASGGDAVYVEWSAPTATNGMPVTCTVPDGMGTTPVSLTGGIFRLGTTRITCSTSTDSASFTVTVLAAGTTIPTTTILTLDYTSVPLGGRIIGRVTTEPEGIAGSYFFYDNGGIQFDGASTAGPFEPILASAIGDYEIRATFVPSFSIYEDSSDTASASITATDEMSPVWQGPAPSFDTVVARPMDTSGLVSWVLPQVTDNSGADPTISCTSTTNGVNTNIAAGRQYTTLDFSVGTYTISCTAADAANNEADLEDFTFTVSPAPTIATPGDQTASLASGATTAPLTWRAPTASNGGDVTCATDDSTATLTPTTGFNPTGGSFPTGSTVVTCGTPGSADTSFTVTVSTITVPGYQIGIGRQNAVDVTWDEAPSASDGSDVTCTVPTGSTATLTPTTGINPTGGNFPQGDTVVTCSTSADSASFTVAVAPAIFNALKISGAPASDDSTTGQTFNYLEVVQNIKATKNFSPNAVYSRNRFFAGDVWTFPDSSQATQIENFGLDITINYSDGTTAVDNDGAFVELSNGEIWQIEFNTDDAVYERKPITSFTVNSFVIIHSGWRTDYVAGSLTGVTVVPNIATPGYQTGIIANGETAIDVSWAEAPTASDGNPVTCTVPDDSTATLLPDLTGGNFPRGSTVVTCSSLDAADASFTVTVAPIIFNALKISGITATDGSIIFPAADSTTNGQTFDYVEVVEQIAATQDSIYPDGVAAGDTWTFPDGSQVVQSEAFSSNITINYSDGTTVSDAEAYFIKLSNGEVWQIEDNAGDTVYQAKPIKSFTVGGFNLEIIAWISSSYVGALTGVTIEPAPTITVPGYQTAALGSGETTATLTWATPTASNGGDVTCAVPTDSTATLTPTSGINPTGGSFPNGSTVVTCSVPGAEDASFTVTVAPIIFNALKIFGTPASDDTTNGQTFSYLEVVPQIAATTGSNNIYPNGVSVGDTWTFPDGSQPTQSEHFILDITISYSDGTSASDDRAYFVRLSNGEVWQIETNTDDAIYETNPITSFTVNSYSGSIGNWDDDFVDSLTGVIIAQTITVPDDQSTTLTSGTSIDVTWDEVTASGTALSPTCTVSPTDGASSITLSGGTFEVGSYAITCSVPGAADASFTVTVIPSIMVPVDQTANLVSGQTTATLTWNQITATNGNAVTCTVAPSYLIVTLIPTTGINPTGGTFPVGAATITCSATGAADASFTVTVTTPAGFKQLLIRESSSRTIAPGDEVNVGLERLYGEAAGSVTFVAVATDGSTRTDLIINSLTNSFPASFFTSFTVIRLEFPDTIAPGMYKIEATFTPTSVGYTVATETVQDTQAVPPGDAVITVTPPPTIITPGYQSATLLASGDTTATLTWNVIETSDGRTVTCRALAPIGSTATLTGNTGGRFPLGDTVITCSATGIADASFTVTVTAFGTAITTRTVLSLDYTSVRFDPRPTDMASLPVTGTVTVTPAGAAGTININFGSVGSTGQESYSIAAGETVVPIIVHVGATPGRMDPVTASFTSSDTAFADSESDGVDVTVTSNPLTTTSLTIPTSVQPGSTVSGTVTVTPAGASGTVNVIIGSTTVASPTIAAGSTEATFAFTAPAVAGSYSIRAAFISDDTSAYENSGSGLQSFTITVAPITFNALKISGAPRSDGTTNGQKFNYVEVVQQIAATTNADDRVANGDIWIFPDGSQATQSEYFTLQITLNYSDETTASDINANFIELSNGEVWQIETNADDAIYEAKPITSFIINASGSVLMNWDDTFEGSLSQVTVVPTITVPGNQIATIAGTQTIADVTWIAAPTASNGSAVTCTVPIGSGATLISNTRGTFPSGDTVVTCSTSAANAFFTVMVREIPSSVTISATRNGNPVSGSINANTEITLSASAIYGSTSSVPGQFTWSLIDPQTGNLIIDPSLDITQRTSGASGEILTFSSQTPGASYTLRALFDPTNTAFYASSFDSFTVTITAIVTIAAPNDQAATPIGTQTTATLTWIAPTASDGGRVTCSVPTGSTATLLTNLTGGTFPSGDTVVTCSATGAADTSFTVSVAAPTGTIIVPGNITEAQPADQSSVAVTFNPAPRLTSGSGEVTCMAQPGSGATLTPTTGINPTGGNFPLGTTQITCQAAGTASASFTVTVRIADTPPQPTLMLVSLDSINIRSGQTLQGAVAIQPTGVYGLLIATLRDSDGQVAHLFSGQYKAESGPSFDLSAFVIPEDIASGAYALEVTFRPNDRSRYLDSPTQSFVLNAGPTPPQFTSLPASRIDRMVPTGTRSVTVFFSPPVTATDDSGETPVILVTSDNVDATSLSVTGGNFPLGTTTVTFTAIDGSNNRTTATIIVEVEEETYAIIPTNVMILGVDMVSIGDTMLNPTVRVSTTVPGTVPGTISYTLQRYGTSDTAIDLGSKSYPGSQSLALPATVTAGQWALRAIFTPDDTASYRESAASRAYTFSIGAREVVLTVTPDPLVATVGTAFTVTPKVEFTVAGATDPITPPGDLRVIGISDGRVVVDGTTNAVGSATARGIEIPADQVRAAEIVFTVTFTPADAGQYAPKAITASVTPAASTSTRIVNLGLSAPALTVSDQETMLTVSVTDIDRITGIGNPVSVGTVTVTEQGTSPLLGGLPGTIDLSQTTRTLSVTPGTAGLARLVISYTGGCVVADQSPCMETFADARSEHVLIVQSADQAVSTVTLTASPDPALAGRSLTLAASVTVAGTGMADGMVAFSLNGESVGDPQPVVEGNASVEVSAESVIAGVHTIVAEFTPTDVSQVSHSRHELQVSIDAAAGNVAPVAPILTLTSANGRPSGLMGTTGDDPLLMSVLATAPNGDLLDGQLEILSTLSILYAASTSPGTVTTGLAQFFVRAPVVAGVYMIEAVFVPTDPSYSEATAMVMVEFVAERIRTSIVVALTTGGNTIDVGGTATVGDEVTLSATVTAADTESVDNLGHLLVVLSRSGTEDRVMERSVSTDGVYRMVLANLAAGSYAVTTEWVPDTVAYLSATAETRSFRVVTDGYVASAVCGPFDWVEDGNGLARTYIRIIGHSGASEIAVRLENTSNAVTGDVRRVLSDASAYGIDMSAPAALLSTWKLESLYGPFGRGDLAIEFTGVEQSDLDCDRLTRSSPLQALTGFGNRATNRDIGDGDR